MEAVYGRPEDGTLQSRSTLELTAGATVAGTTTYTADLTLPAGPLGSTSSGCSPGTRTSWSPPTCASS